MNLRKEPHLSKNLETFHNLHLQHQPNALCHCAPEYRVLKVLFFELCDVLPQETGEYMRQNIHALWKSRESELLTSSFGIPKFPCPNS